MIFYLYVRPYSKDHDPRYDIINVITREYHISDDDLWIMEGRIYRYKNHEASYFIFS